MKRNTLFLKFFPLFLSLFLLCGAVPVRAAESEDFYAGKTPEDLVALVLEETEADEESLALGYCNTVTGEEYYYNPDRYFSGASLYKLPLNMYCAEQVSRGERDWDTETLSRPYEEIQVSSLTYSNNPLSLQLVNELGGWVEFRERIAPYMGEDAADETYTARHTFFTARQMTHCTALLARESERFPRVIDCLLDSAPELFLNYADVPYDIAQKYGNNSEEGNVFHVAGIVYTDDPIVLVVLSANLASQETAMARFCELMCGYTQYQRQLRLEEEAEAQRLQEEAERKAAEQAAAQKAAEEAAEQAVREAEARRLAEEEALRQAAEDAARERAAQRQRLGLLTGAAVLVAIGCIAALIMLHKRK